MLHVYVVVTIVLCTISGFGLGQLESSVGDSHQASGQDKGVPPLT